jgi:hypothetical protein
VEMAWSQLCRQVGLLHTVIVPGTQISAGPESCLLAGEESWLEEGLKSAQKSVRPLQPSTTPPGYLTFCRLHLKYLRGRLPKLTSWPCRTGTLLFSVTSVICCVWEVPLSLLLQLGRLFFCKLTGF